MDDQTSGDYTAALDAAEVEILVVEDSPTQALFLEQILADGGYRVSTAYTGEEALDRLREYRHTLVISDIVMPGMDGYELCRKMKADEDLKDVPVVLLTSLSDPIDILRGLECGADNFITKPYDGQSLLSRIQYVLINDRMRRKYAVGTAMKVFFAGRKHLLTAERVQIIDLLLSSFEAAVAHKLELEKVNIELRQVNERLLEEIAERQKAEEDKEHLILELREALAQVKKLSGFLPICSSCKKIRNDEGYWQQIEAYIAEHSEADFSHSICPDCAERLYPELKLYDE
ncbi:response regulator [Thermodesulfobacteriota bacterium]